MSAIANESDVILGDFYWVWIDMSTFLDDRCDPIRIVAMPWQLVDQDGNRGPIRWEGCGGEVRVLSIVAKVEPPPLPEFQSEVDAIMRRQPEREAGQ